MPKVFGFILLILLLAIMFVSPVRNYLNGLFHKDNNELKETQIIGTVSGYSPRVKEIQEILKEAEFDPGSIDGVMGRQTRMAIRDFQKKKGLRPTGKIDSTTQLALNREKEIVKSSPQPLIEIDTSLDRESASIAKDTHLEIVKDDLTKKAKVQDEVLSFRLKSKDRVKQIQSALKKVNFYKGEIDGKSGPQTKRAIKAFQKSKGLTPDGIVGSRTWDELNKYLKD
jgi:peptidoglycan hydrolase-like protein with peptidoglycan-binding domain